MPSSEVIRARIDARIKQEAEVILEAIGLTVSDAFRLIMMRVVAERRLPFEPLIRTRQQFRLCSKPVVAGARFNSVEELMADLNAGD